MKAVKQSVRLIGYPRAFTQHLRKTLADCGLRTEVEKGVPSVRQFRRSPAINIFEVKTRRERIDQYIAGMSF